MFQRQEATTTLHFTPAFTYKLQQSYPNNAMKWKPQCFVIVCCFIIKTGALVVWETMLGRHEKPGNGRKRKRAVWPPLPHLLGDTGNRETGRGGGEGGYWEGRDKYMRCRFWPTIKSLPKLSSPLSSSPSLMAFTSWINFLRMPAWSILQSSCNVSFP